jgi:hypothetical protein
MKTTYPGINYICTYVPRYKLHTQEWSHFLRSETGVNLHTLECNHVPRYETSYPGMTLSNSVQNLNWVLFAGDDVTRAEVDPDRAREVPGEPQSMRASMPRRRQREGTKAYLAEISWVRIPKIYVCWADWKWLKLTPWFVGRYMHRCDLCIYSSVAVDKCVSQNRKKIQ